MPSSEAQEPLRADTGEELGRALDERYRTGQPVEVPSMEHARAWCVFDECDGSEGEQ